MKRKRYSTILTSKTPGGLKAKELTELRNPSCREAGARAGDVSGGG